MWCGLELGQCYQMLSHDLCMTRFHLELWTMCFCIMMSPSRRIASIPSISLFYKSHVVTARPNEPRSHKKPRKYLSLMLTILTIPARSDSPKYQCLSEPSLWLKPQLLLTVRQLILDHAGLQISPLPSTHSNIPVTLNMPSPPLLRGFSTRSFVFNCMFLPTQHRSTSGVTRFFILLMSTSDHSPRRIPWCSVHQHTPRWSHTLYKRAWGPRRSGQALSDSQSMLSLVMIRLLTKCMVTSPHCGIEHYWKGANAPTLLTGLVWDSEMSCEREWPANSWSIAHQLTLHVIPSRNTEPRASPRPLVETV